MLSKLFNQLERLTFYLEYKNSRFDETLMQNLRKANVKDERIIYLSELMTAEIIGDAVGSEKEIEFIEAIDALPEGIRFLLAASNTLFCLVRNMSVLASVLFPDDPEKVRIFAKDYEESAGLYLSFKDHHAIFIATENQHQTVAEILYHEIIHRFDTLAGRISGHWLFKQYYQEDCNRLANSSTEWSRLQPVIGHYLPAWTGFGNHDDQKKAEREGFAELGCCVLLDKPGFYTLKMRFL